MQAHGVFTYCPECDTESRSAFEPCHNCGYPKKTIKDHRHSLMVAALKDDLNINYAKRIVACEMLAHTLGGDYLCDEEFIALQMNNLDIVTH